MKYDTLSSRYKIGVCVIGLVFLSWLFGVFVVLPARQHLTDMENKLEIERNWVKKGQEFSSAYPEPVKYLKRLNDKLHVLVQLLPPESQISEFLLQSEIAARHSGVHLIALKPGGAVIKNGYREYPIELVVNGSFFQTMNFIKAIEAGMRFNNVSSLVIQVKSGSLESRLLVHIYSL